MAKKSGFVSIAALCLLLAGVAIVLSGCGNNTPQIQSSTTPSEPIAGYTLYTNKDEGLSLQYPSTWEKKEPTDQVKVEFFSPIDDEKDLFQENVNILKSVNTPDTADFGEFVDVNKEELAKSMEKYKLVEEKDETLPFGQSKTLIYTGSYSGLDLKWRQYYINNGKNYFIATYTALEDGYDKHVEEMQKMMESMRSL